MSGSGIPFGSGIDRPREYRGDQFVCGCEIDRERDRSDGKWFCVRRSSRRLRQGFGGNRLSWRYEMRFRNIAGIATAGAASLLVAMPALAQTTGTLSGQVVDANTQQPVADAVVIAQSPALQGEQTAVTDTTGSFEITLLPAGNYTLTVQRESYQPFTQQGLKVNLDRTIRVRLSLVPEALKEQAIEIVAQRPSIAVTTT